MMDSTEFINRELPNATTYQKFLVSWIIDIGIKNRDSFNYDNIKDIAIGIYLLCKDLNLDPSDSDNIFIKYFSSHYGYGSLVHKLITDINSRKPDLLELLSEITWSDYNNNFMSSHDFTNHLETLYNNTKISEEENEETLIFGDNILNNEMSIRELIDSVRTMTEEYVCEYLSHLNLGDITFTISESSIMYLKDTDGIKIAVVTTNDGNRHVIRYTNENGSALFLLFEPKFIKNETIYGLSLDMETDDNRGLLILEKDKDGSIYKFLYGRSDF